MKKPFFFQKKPKGIKCSIHTELHWLQTLPLLCSSEILSSSSLIELPWTHPPHGFRDALHMVMSNINCTWISCWKFYTWLPRSVYAGHCCISHCQIPWGCFKLILYHLPLHVLYAKEKCGFGEQKNTCMSVVGKHRYLSLKIEASVLIELNLARTEMNIFVWEPFTCNSDCMGQSILSEVSSVREIKQELGMCLSIDLIILLILW